jgi:hypothetical protein
MNQREATIAITQANKVNLETAINAIRGVMPLGFGGSAKIIAAIEGIEALIEENEAEIARLDAAHDEGKNK